MLLALDLGNSRIKWGLFDALTPKGRGYFPTEQFRPTEEDTSIFELSGSGSDGVSSHPASSHHASHELSSLLRSVTLVAVCSVAGRAVEEALLAHLHHMGLEERVQTVSIQASPQACGVINHYDAPTRLGADRWSALVAARARSSIPTIVVMAGTATTVDALNRHGDFLGGTILPGVRLMPKSLYERTAGIQEGDGSWAEFPTNTADAVASGVLAATAGAIAGMIHNLQLIHHEPIQLLLSGGNSPLLVPRLSALGFQPQYERDLVLQGIALLVASNEFS